MTADTNNQTGVTVLRQWRILSILGKRPLGAAVKELADECQCESRTIHRDLKVLKEAGFPLKSKTGPHGRKNWKLDEGLIPTLNLTWDEAAALFISRKLLEPLAGTFIWEGAQEAYHKLQQCFDQHALKYLAKLAQIFHPTRFGTRDYSNYSEILETLMIAIEDRKVLSLSYQSQEVTEPVTRDVYPYAIVYHKGTLYLIGWGVERGAFRNYKVDRISNAEIDPKSLPFNRAADFDLKHYLAGSFGIFHSDRDPVKVRVQFQPSVVRYVEEKSWHSTETLTRQPDGTLIAEFQLTAFEEVKSWILSFGPNAKVLEPPELIEEVLRDLRQTLQSYAPTAPIDGTSKSRVKIHRNTGEEPT